MSTTTTPQSPPAAPPPGRHGPRGVSEAGSARQNASALTGIAVEAGENAFLGRDARLGADTVKELAGAGGRSHLVSPSGAGTGTSRASGAKVAAHGRAGKEPNALEKALGGSTDLAQAAAVRRSQGFLHDERGAIERGTDRLQSKTGVDAVGLVGAIPEVGAVATAALRTEALVERQVIHTGRRLTLIALAGSLVLAAVVVSGVSNNYLSTASAAGDPEAKNPSTCFDPSLPGGGAVPAGTVSPGGAVQTNANIIVGVGRALGVSDRGLTIALMVTLVESEGLNLASRANPGSLAFPHDGVAPGDYDSVGLFQQRDAWGPMADRMDPAKSAVMFYTGGRAGQQGLLDKAGWELKEMGRVAQSVQGSAFPDRYAQRVSQASALLAAASGVGPATLPAGAVSGPPAPGGGSFAGEDPNAGAAEPVCPTAGGPAFSNTASGDAKAWIDAGMKVLGTPYSWGGGTINGPSGGFAQGTGIIGFDCSSLMRYMIYQGSGGKIEIPRVTGTQYGATKGNQVPLDQLMPGDLLFYGASGESSYHVAMYLGDNQMIEAPQTGLTVRVTPVRRGQLVVATRLA